MARDQGLASSTSATRIGAGVGGNNTKMLESRLPFAVAPAKPVIAHVQLRDLIIAPHEPGIVNYVVQNGIVEQDLHVYGAPSRVLSHLSFTPNTLSYLPIGDNGDTLIAAGGQDREIYLSYYASSPSSTDPRPSSLKRLSGRIQQQPRKRTRLWEFEDKLTGSINNSVLLTPLTTTTAMNLTRSNESSLEPRVAISNNDGSVRFYDVPIKAGGSGGGGGSGVSTRSGRSLTEVGEVRLGEPINHSSISPDGRTLLSVGDSRRIYLHRIKGGAEVTFESITNNNFGNGSSSSANPWRRGFGSPSSNGASDSGQGGMQLELPAPDMSGLINAYERAAAASAAAASSRTPDSSPPAPGYSPNSPRSPAAYAHSPYPSANSRYTSLSFPPHPSYSYSYSYSYASSIYGYTGPGTGGVAGTLAASFSTAFSDGDGTKFAVGGQEGVVAVWDVRYLGRPMRVWETDKMRGVPGGWREEEGRDFSTHDEGSEYGAASGWISVFEDPWEWPRGNKAPGWCVRSVKFGKSKGKEVLAFTEHTSLVHVVDARTFETEDVIRVPTLRHGGNNSPSSMSGRTSVVPRVTADPEEDELRFYVPDTGNPLRSGEGIRSRLSMTTRARSDSPPMVTSANSEMAVEPPISNVRGSGLGSTEEDEDLEEDEVRVTVAPTAMPSPLRWSLTAPSSPSMNPTANPFSPSERLRPRIRAAELIRREEQLSLRRNQALRASLDNVRDAIEDASRGLEGVLERLEGAGSGSTPAGTADASSSTAETTRTVEGTMQRRASYSPPASIGDSTWRTLGGASLPIPGVVTTTSNASASVPASNPTFPRPTTAPASTTVASSSSEVPLRNIVEERMRRYLQQRDQEDPMTRWTIINDLPPFTSGSGNGTSISSSSNNDTSGTSVSSTSTRSSSTRTREELDAQIQRILDHGRIRERERERMNALRPREEVEREEMERLERNARMDADIERILSESRAERRRRRRERRNRLDRPRNEYEIAEEEEDGEIVVLPDFGDIEEGRRMRTVLAGHGIRSRVGSWSGEAANASTAGSTNNMNGMRQRLLERMARMRRMNSQASEQVMMRWDMEDAATDEQEIDDDDDMMDVDEPDEAGGVDMIDDEAANIYSTRFPSPLSPPSPPPVLRTMSRTNHQESSSSSSSASYRRPSYSSADFDVDSASNEMSPKALKKHEEAQRRRLSAYGKVYYRPDLDIAGMCFDPSGERMYVLGVVMPQDDVPSEQGGWGDDDEIPRERGGGAVVEWKINGANKMWFVDGPGEGWL